MAYEWGRFLWWADKNASGIQALTSIVMAVFTIVLATVTYVYMKMTQRQAQAAARQLHLLAHPNLSLEPHLDRERKYLAMHILNRGAYPFRINNVIMSWQLDDDTLSWVHKPQRELEGVIVGAQDRAIADYWFHDDKVELDSGAIEDMSYISFTCCDVLNLFELRYRYSRITGLRRIGLQERNPE